MQQRGTPPLVPMWPQPQIRELNQNPYPFFPFDPHWGEDLAVLEFETFCSLLQLAWVSPRPCFLPPDPEVLDRMLEPYRLRDGTPISPRVLTCFSVHPETGFLFFPPQLRALARLVAGENMYSLLWDNQR